MAALPACADTGTIYTLHVVWNRQRGGRKRWKRDAIGIANLPQRDDRTRCFEGKEEEGQKTNDKDRRRNITKRGEGEERAKESARCEKDWETDRNRQPHVTKSRKVEGRQSDGSGRDEEEEEERRPLREYNTRTRGL